jgi:hypothetical protein
MQQQYVLRRNIMGKSPSRLTVVLLVVLVSITTSCSDINTSDYKYIEGSSSKYTCSVPYDGNTQLELPVNEGDYLQIAITGDTIQLDASVTDPSGKNLGAYSFPNGKPQAVRITIPGNYKLLIQGPGSFTVKQVGAQDHLTVTTAAFTRPLTAVTPSTMIWLVIPAILGVILIVGLFMRRRIVKVPCPAREGAIPTGDDAASHPHASSPMTPLYEKNYFGPDGPGMNSSPPADRPFVDPWPFVDPYGKGGNPSFVQAQDIWPEMPWITDMNPSVHRGMNSMKLNRLVKEGKVTPGDAIKYQRDIEERDDDWLSQRPIGSLLDAIDMREE